MDQLQLGLSLPSNIPIKGKGFDLNSSYGYDPIEVLGSDPLSHLDRCSSNKDANNTEYSKKKKKRCFDEAFDQDLYDVVPRTLPLLFCWNTYPNNEDEEDEDGLKELDNNSLITNKNIDENGVVGWPPIRSWRKKFCYDQNQGGLAKINDPTAETGGSKYKYVKVKMEGVAIARKVDLSVHNCYQTLTDTLIGMFGKCHEDNLKDYKVTYQDKEGDWLLAGDIPWGTFIKSVQRLKLLRGSN